MTSLHDLRSAVALTAAEKYKILQERDKLVRAALGLHMKKQTELSEAKVLRGTCEDMCPEMERHVREDRRRLSVYEIVPESEMAGKNPLVDHRLAVKEYSRSSADQDLPLPHELRPAPVLLRTMHYLLNNIADRGGDGRWADWFDFLWNRTRGIRKDITQQQLCDLTAVDLVEKCARFHIYCGERLCEEDMMVFDEKINNENLTKCLQTLKELYHDLASQQVACPREAEFRAYMVLMNLNSGDILREVQQLPEELRRSDVIGFVVRVYSALNSHNYLRFFKLVKRATFLNACIMHRYFYQVRVKAFHILMRAYNKKEPCPAQELVRTLGFENEAEAVHFSQYHGLQTDGTNVILDRTYFVEPEAAYPKMRAKVIIESKQQTSIGETINGEPLPANVIPEPRQNSFDATGRYVASDLDSLPVPLKVPGPAEVVQERESVTRRVSPMLRRPSPAFGQPENDSTSTTDVPRRASPFEPEITKPQIPNEIVKDIAKNLFIEVIGEFVDQMSTQLIKAIKLYLDYDKPVTSELVQRIVQEDLQSLSEEVLLECHQEAAESEARLRAEKSLCKQRAEATLTELICEETIDEELRIIAQDQCRRNETELEHESMLRCSKEAAEQLLDEVADELTVEVIEEVYETDVADRLVTLEQNEHAVELLRTAKYLNRWKNRYAARIRLKKAMLTFPPTPSFMTTTEQFETLVPRSQGLNSFGVHLGAKRARLTLQSPVQLADGRHRLEQNMVLRHYWREKRREVAFAPLDVALIVHQELNRTVKKTTRTRALSGGSKVHFKMLVRMRGDVPGSDDLHEWLTSKLNRGAVPTSPVQGHVSYLSMYSTQMEGKPIGICVNAIQGRLHDRQLGELGESQFLHAVNAVLYVLPNDSAGSKISWSKERQDLVEILRSLQNHDKPSLAILCSEPNIQAPKIEQMMDLDRLVCKGLVTSYSIHVMSDSYDQPGASKTLKNAVRGLVSQSRDHYVIESLPVTEYVEHFLHKHFFAVVYEHQAQTSTELPVCELVEVFNTLMEQLISLACEEQQNLSETVCKQRVHVIARIQDLLSDVTLPEPGELERGSPQQAVYRYVEEVAASAESTSVLYNSVAHTVRRWRRNAEWAVFEEEAVFPWTSIIMTCVQFKLSQLSLALSRLCNEEGVDHLVLYFRRKSLDTFKPPLLALDRPPQGHSKTPIVKSKLPADFQQASSDKRIPPGYDLPIHSPTDTCISTPEKGIADFAARPSTPEKDCVDICTEFEWAAAREKSRNAQFEKYLKSMLEGGCPVTKDAAT